MSSSEQPVEYMTVKEMANRLRLSKSTIYDLIDSGSLPCIVVGAKGRKILVTKADFQTYLDGCKKPTRKPDDEPGTAG